MADQGAEGLLSPFLRKKRFDAAKPFLNGRILDFGCGAGGLAEYVPHDRYLGVDIDKYSLKQAQTRFPRHRFVADLSEVDDKFDSVVSLAVIEHVPKPAEFLRALAGHLDDSAGACLTVTTPHPSVDWVHDVGAVIGLFSKHANEEHEDLLDRAKLQEACSCAGLKLVLYRRFLLGANQLAVFERR